MLTRSPRHIAHGLLEALQSSTRQDSSLSNFVAWLHQSGNWSRRHAIVSAFADEEARMHKISRAVITTARALDKDEQSAIEKVIKTSGENIKDVIAEWRVDETVLGGIKIEFDGTVLDATLSHNISSLAAAIK